MKPHKATENVHLVNHHYRQYIKYRSKNTKDGSWDFGELCTIKFRACKFRINDPKSGKEEWEVVLTNLNRAELSLKKDQTKSTICAGALKLHSKS